MLPEEDITRLQMSVADGMKLIISGGAVVPNPATGEAVVIKNPPQTDGEVSRTRA